MVTKVTYKCYLHLPDFDFTDEPAAQCGLVVKSKLPPRSGSSLEAVEPHP